VKKISAAPATAGRPAVPSAAPAADARPTPAERLAAGVAHDLNNLLTTISGFSEVLLAELPADSAEHHELGEIARAAERIAELARDLQDYGARRVLAPREVELHALLAGLEPALVDRLGAAIALTIRRGAPDSRVIADAEVVERMIGALALAARDATPPGGRVTLATRAHRVADDGRAALPPGDYVALDVLDAGARIGADRLPHLFEPYVATKELGRGTGLGLAVALRAARLSGGTIEARSDESGTTLTLLLPAPPRGGEAERVEQG
jgi:two-component system cell cycle sensor histidine kinase/response regulator CckA